MARNPIHAPYGARGPLHAATLCLLCAALPAACGCAGLVPPPIQTEAALGRVIIYRNGVAYYESEARL
ncbi:MAG: hypothetical protein HY744_23250 [Deltaproteobacteria bacterium]|nr:hypothetical protein [Deltaproteobacteria bacterium]